MKRLSPLAILLAVAVFFAIYVGSYFALLTTGTLPVPFSARYVRVAHYRIDNFVTRAAFRPLFWLDQKMRPQCWSRDEGSKMSTGPKARRESHGAVADAPLNP